MSHALNIDDKIWITSRIRMIAERKLARNQLLSHITVTYYSLFTVLLSIFSDFYRDFYSLIDQINIAATVVVLVASLVAGGFRFEARAGAFRECYLRLQSLLDQNKDIDVKKSDYNEILASYPNHSQNDYYDLIISQTAFENKELRNGENKIEATAFIWASYILRKFCFYFSVFILMTIPAAFLSWPATR